MGLHSCISKAMLLAVGLWASLSATPRHCEYMVILLVVLW